MKEADPRITHAKIEGLQPPVVRGDTVRGDTVRRDTVQCDSIQGGSAPVVSQDPPVVIDSVNLTTPPLTNRFTERLMRWKDVSGGQQTAPDYGVPRVFDLFTLMAITLAFALLFALLKLLSPAFDASATSLTLIISGFVVLIAMAQMFMFEGNNPRLSSIVAGPIAMLTIMITAWIPSGDFGVITSLVVSLIFSVLFGFLLGYLAGAVVAGVLLVADAMRGRSIYRRSPLVKAETDVTFDDIE